MKLLRVAVIAAALALAFGLSDRAEAKTWFSFGYCGPGITVYSGHYPRYYHSRYYHPRHRYRYRYRYRRPYRRYRTFGGRCARWSRACAANWGYGGPSYRGCLRYHGCR